MGSSMLHITALVVTILVSGANVAVALTAAQRAKSLHCRYDVSTPVNYWYKQWALTTGCKPQATKSGGIRDATLMAYYQQKVADRGEWFDVVRWANKSTNCLKNATTTTCMSCSMNMPRFAMQRRVVPFGVYDGWWLYPEPGAACGMCYKVMLPEGKMTQRCADAKANNAWDKYESYPECPGNGDSPYLTTSQNSWAWNAKIYKDKASGLPYLIGINVEWYDLDVALEYGISYLTQGQKPDGKGNWPLIISPIPCPVGKNKLEYAFVVQDKPAQSPEEYFFKLQLAGQRIAVSKVEIQWQGESKWYSMNRAGDQTDRGYGDGDGHWQVARGAANSISSSAKVNLKIFCADGSKPKIEYGLVPSAITCKWQDPKCVRFMGKVQC